MFPVDPDVFDTDISAIVDFAHQPQDAGVINGVARKRALQSALARAARMKMRRVREQRLAGAVGQADAREMRVIERQRQTRNVAHKPQSGLRVWRNRAGMRLDAEDDPLPSSLCDAPCK